MKQAIGERSRQANAPKCPAKYSSDDVEVQLYCTELFDFITTNPKKCCPMKWWSHEVVQELLAFHLLYTASYSPAKQDLAFLAAKQQEQCSKFAMDQKNREALFQEKCLLEEEERKETAKSWNVLAESSLKLAYCLQKMSDRPSPDTILVAVNEKIQAVEEKVGKALDKKLGSYMYCPSSIWLNHKSLTRKLFNDITYTRRSILAQE